MKNHSSRFQVILYGLIISFFLLSFQGKQNTPGSFSSEKTLAQQPDSLINEETEIQAMVFSMHEAWEDLPISKDPEQIIAFFLPQFATNQISIDIENHGQIARFSHADYKAYLKEIINRKGFAYEFDNVKFLDIEIKEKIYFNVVYKCLLRHFQDDKLVKTNSILVTITGKQDNSEWKIASYSWVNFEYE